MKRIIIITLVSLLVLFLLIQLIPYGRQHTNPPVVQEPKWDSPQTRVLTERACFDCHSNETDWPWYSNIAPISWLVQRDVDQARQRFNFSDWSSSWIAGLFPEVIREGEMPPSRFLIMHPEARLSQSEKDALVSGLQATFSDQ